MKTVMIIIKWFYLIYLPCMFAWMGMILFEINVLKVNPWHINTNFGSQFLLGYLMFMCVIAFYALLVFTKPNTYEPRKDS